MGSAGLIVLLMTNRMFSIHKLAPDLSVFFYNVVCMHFMQSFLQTLTEEKNLVGELCNYKLYSLSMQERESRTLHMYTVRAKSYLLCKFQLYLSTLYSVPY